MPSISVYKPIKILGKNISNQRLIILKMISLNFTLASYNCFLLLTKYPAHAGDKILTI